MAAPVFHAAGSAVYTADNVATPTTLSPSAPTRTAGDLLLFITCCIKPGASATTPAGYTAWFNFSSGTASGGRIQVFARTATNTAADDASCVWSSLTTGTSGSSCSARILSYSNAVPYYEQFITTGQFTDTAATTSWTLPAVTTLTANALVVGISLKVSDTNQTTTITNLTERSDDATQTGTGHITQVSDIVVASPGSSGTGTVTPSNTTSSRVLAVAIPILAVQPALITTTTTAVNDTFTDADGTALTSHTGETGATWTSHGSYTTGAKVNTNRVDGEAVSGLHYASGVPASADYMVEGVVRRVTNLSSSQSGFALRVATGADTSYQVVWSEFVGTAVWYFRKVVAGTTTVLGTLIDAPADGTNRTVRVEIAGVLMSVYLDGALIFQVADSAISAAGRAGVRTNLGSSSTGYHVDSLAAYTRSALTASSVSSATLALTATALPPLSVASAVASATVALTAKTTIALGASSVVASATLAVAAPMPVPLGASSAQSSATLNLAQYVPLASASAVSSATLALRTATQIPTSASSAVSSTTLALTAQTAIALGASSALSSATLALTAKQPVPLGASSAQSSATLNLTQYVPLSNASAVSSATLVLVTSTTVPLGSASAVSTTALALTALTQVPLAASSATASGTLTVTTGATVPMGASSALSSASLVLTAKTLVSLQASSATSSTALSVTTGTQVPLAASSATSSTTLALSAATRIPLGSASAVASATLGVTAGASTVPLAAASSTASTTLALTATTQIPLGASSPAASATLALTAKTTIALGASSAQSSATLAVSLPAPAIVGLETANVQVSATLAASAKTTAILQGAGIQATATLALSAGTLVVLLASTASSSATLALTAPFFTPIPEWDQHTGTEWLASTDSEWVSTPEAAEGALYPAADLYPDSELYPSRTVEGGDWEESSDEEWILA